MSRRSEGRNIVNIGSHIILKVPHNKKVRTSIAHPENYIQWFCHTHAVVKKKK